MRKQGKKKLHLQIMDASIITALLGGLGVSISYFLMDIDMAPFMVSAMTVTTSTGALLCANAYGKSQLEKQEYSKLEELERMKEELEEKKDACFNRMMPAYTKEDNILTVDFEQIKDLNNKEKKLKYKK